MPLEEIKSIRREINLKKHEWSSGLTSHSELSNDDRKVLLGLTITEEEIKSTVVAMEDEDAKFASEGVAFIYTPVWDWRNVSGRDWTTPIKNQGACGSCVAFGTVATIESNYEIFKRMPSLNPNLSEADLFFCGCGNCCSTGWNFPPALDYAKNKGIPDEVCFPYTDRNQPCKPCADREKRILKIKSWAKISVASQAKDWINRKGPVLTGMAVYNDFFSYRSGVYRHATGALAGYHAICVVGYNEISRYWICKNSWGTGWGERGWFRIGYGECGIGTSFPFYSVRFN